MQLKQNQIIVINVSFSQSKTASALVITYVWKIDFLWISLIVFAREICTPDVIRHDWKYLVWLMINSKIEHDFHL